MPATNATANLAAIRGLRVSLRSKTARLSVRLRVVEVPAAATLLFWPKRPRQPNEPTKKLAVKKVPRATTAAESYVAKIDTMPA